MRILLQYLRYAFRQILLNPGFSLTAVLSLTLGIGATVAVYSVLYDAVLNPWPYGGMDRISEVWMTDNAGHDGVWRLTGPQIRQLRQAHAAEDVPVLSNRQETITGGDAPEDVRAITVTGSAFQFLGLPPLLGRPARWQARLLRGFRQPVRGIVGRRRGTELRVDPLRDFEEGLIGGDWGFFCAVQYRPRPTRSILPALARFQKCERDNGEAFELFRAREGPFLDEGPDTFILKPLHL